MFGTGEKEGHTQMCLTFIFKVNRQGQVIYSKFSEITDIVNVRIDTTKFESIACIQPEISKVIGKMCLTLTYQVKRQGHGIYFIVCDIPDLENVTIDTKL